MPEGQDGKVDIREHDMADLEDRNKFYLKQAGLDDY